MQPRGLERVGAARGLAEVAAALPILVGEARVLRLGGNREARAQAEAALAAQLRLARALGVVEPEDV